LIPYILINNLKPLESFRMGNGVVVPHEGPSLTALALQTHILSTALVSDSIVLGGDIVHKCRDSLKFIFEIHEGAGRATFFDIFWEALQAADGHHEIVPKFEPLAIACEKKAQDKNVLLIRMLRFMTNNSPHAFKLKVEPVRIRHLAIGIEERHLLIFCEALLRAITFVLGPKACPGIVECWAQLLGFAIFHMSKTEVGIAGLSSRYRSRKAAFAPRELFLVDAASDDSGMTVGRTDSLVTESPLCEN
jgi:hemoglobin-like flavoprotein